MARTSKITTMSHVTPIPHIPPSIIFGISQTAEVVRSHAFVAYSGVYRSHQPIGLILPWTTWQAPVPIMPMQLMPALLPPDAM